MNKITIPDLAKALARYALVETRKDNSGCPDDYGEYVDFCTFTLDIPFGLEEAPALQKDELVIRSGKIRWAAYLATCDDEDTFEPHGNGLDRHDYDGFDRLYALVREVAEKEAKDILDGIKEWEENGVFILIDERQSDGSLFTTEYSTASEAIASAEAEWSSRPSAEKRNTRRYEVIKSADPDKNSEYHLDGDVVKEWK